MPAGRKSPRRHGIHPKTRGVHAVSLFYLLSLLFTLLFVVLHDGAAAEGGQQVHQVPDLLLELAAHVGLGDLHPVLHPLEDHRGGGDVLVAPDGVVPAAEGLMGHQAQAGGVVDQSVAGDAGGLLVGLAESPIDD